MLALTYPDGARVQRCDYLPESDLISRDCALGRWTGFERLAITSASEESKRSHTLSGELRHSSRHRRRSSRRDELRRRNHRNKDGNDDDVSDVSSRTKLQSTAVPSTFQDAVSMPCETYRVPGSPQSTKVRFRAGTNKSLPGTLRASSQSPTIFDERFREDHGTPSSSYGRRESRVVAYEEESHGKHRRLELSGRESWPGGRHPKDRSLLQVVLILVLFVIGSNRHSGHFGSKVNRTAFGVFAIGSVVRGVNCAPVDLAAAAAADAGVRSERSANLSHITGSSRKIQMYVKNRHLQILPDGTVNGSNDDTSDYTVLQRTSVSRGQLRIQGVATCLYLCMDSCGVLYGSHEYTEDCVFNETLEQHNYNTYSSARWSTPRKTLYLGLSGRGQPRRVQAKGHNLGRLSAYARVLTQVVAPDRVEALQLRMLNARHHVRHHHGSQQIVCPVPVPQEKDGRDKFRCRKRKKRKKRRRKCRPGETPGPQCEERDFQGAAVEAQSKRSCEGAAVDEACRKEALETPSKKRKSRIEEELTDGGKVEPEDPDDEGAAEVEKKSRRSNGGSEVIKDINNIRHQKKNGKGGKKSGANVHGKKGIAGRRRNTMTTLTKNNNKNNTNSNNTNKNNNNGSNNGTMKNNRNTKKKGALHPPSRVTRTTNQLRSSPAMTSPLPLLYSGPIASRSSVERVSFSTQERTTRYFTSSGAEEDATTTSATLLWERQESSASSLASVSAVSIAATSLASTLTLALTGTASVTGTPGDSGSGEERGGAATGTMEDLERSAEFFAPAASETSVNQRTADEGIDLQGDGTQVDVNVFEGDEEEEHDDDDDDEKEQDEIGTAIGANVAVSDYLNDEMDQRLAM